MRVAFALWPAAAHFYPFAPVAWALRAAGHEVMFLSHPSLGPTVVASGLPFMQMCSAAEMPTPAGPAAEYPREREEMDRITAALDIPEEDFGRWDVVAQGFLPSMWDFIPFQGSPDDPMPAMDGTVAFFREWRPDLVIWDPCVPGAAVAARAVGAAQMRLSGTDFNGWFQDTHARLTSGPGAPQVPNPFAETVRAMAEKYAVPVDHDTLYGQWTLDHVPPGMNFPVDTRRIAMGWIPYTAQTEMPEWLYPVRRPRIAVSLGMSVRHYLPGADWSFIAVLLEALADLDVEVVATLNATQLAAVPQIPGNVRTIDYLPLDQLMQTSALLIHHGGIGTMATAGHAGVPQLIVGRGSTSSAGYKLSAVTGRYVTGFGAGELMDFRDRCATTLRDQIMRVLKEPSFCTGAARLRQDLVAAPSPVEIVPMLERLALAR
jgi:UDP:flavonoid glycosyltransferase YjiC (YdhE family)